MKIKGQHVSGVSMLWSWLLTNVFEYAFLPLIFSIREQMPCHDVNVYALSLHVLLCFALQRP
jgi:hypothetical protein